MTLFIGGCESSKKEKRTYFERIIDYSNDRLDGSLLLALVLDENILIIRFQTKSTSLVGIEVHVFSLLSAVNFIDCKHHLVW